MPRSLKGVGQVTENKKHKKSLLYAPPRKPAEFRRQRKGLKGQLPLFDDVPIAHLTKKNAK